MGRGMGSSAGRLKPSKFINKSGLALLKMIKDSPNQYLLRPQEIECIRYCDKMLREWGGDIMPNEERQLRDIAMAICKD